MSLLSMPGGGVWMTTQGDDMEKTLIVTALTSIIGILGPQAMAADNLVRFQGGIGVIPVSSGVVPTPPPNPPPLTSETVNRNFVRGVPPPGQIWVIGDLRADVKVDGRIKVDGRGLLLGGGTDVGTNGNQRVFATLICEVTPATTPRTFTLHSTDSDDSTAGNQGVPLEPNGDFSINDVLSPTPPNPCVNPVLLIRNEGGAWFAAGIPKL
jgi:hypothetical protein